MKENYKNILLRSLFIGSIAVFLFACKSNSQSPGFEYMPDMYRSPALEPYVSYPGHGPGFGNTNKMIARQPIKGTMPRGFVRYHLDPSDSGYFAAGNLLHNPLIITKQVIGNGKQLFDIYCSVCHGTKGDGKGTITNPAYKAVPNYKDTLPTRRGGHGMRDLKDGNIFHVTTFGLNAMGSYASQLTKKERWEIISYVHTLQGRDPIKEQQERLSKLTDEQRLAAKKKSEYWLNDYQK